MADVNYYVDSTVGSSGNGLSWATAWKNLSNINWSTVAASISAGNTVYINLKKGSTWNETLLPGASGVSGRPITIRQHPDDTGVHPIIGAEAIVPGWNTAGNWTPNGNIWSMSWAGPSGGVGPKRLWLSGTEAGVAANATVTNTEKWFWGSSVLYIYSTSNPASAFSSMTYPNLLYGVADESSPPHDYLTFDGIDVRYCRNYSFYLRGNDYFIAKNCHIGYRCGGVGISVLRQGGVRETSSNGQIYDCIFDTDYTFSAATHKGIQDYIEDGINLGAGSNSWLVHDNTLTNWGHASIYLQTNSATYTNNNNKIYRNFSTSPDIVYGAGIDASGPAGGGTGNEIYDNFTYDTAVKCQVDFPYLKYYRNIIVGTRGIVAIGGYPTSGSGLTLEGFANGASQNMEIYNNVVANCYNYGLEMSSTVYTTENNLLKNNIFFNNGAGAGTNYQIYIWNGTGVNTYMNNCAFKTGQSVTIFYKTAGETVATFNLGHAGETISDNISGNPLFINAGGSYALDTDFKLQSESPCINAGVDVGLTTDYGGFSIVGNPDIGAWELSDKIYSRGDYGSLPATAADLETFYTGTEVTAVATNDDTTYVSQAGSSQYAIHEFKNDATGKSSCTVTWDGQSTLDNTDDYPTILEIYNTNTLSWEELDRDASTVANTDFQLSFPIMSGLDNYKDANGLITCRVYQSGISR